MPEYIYIGARVILRDQIVTITSITRGIYGYTVTFVGDANATVEGSIMSGKGSWRGMQPVPAPKNVA